MKLNIFLMSSNCRIMLLSGLAICLQTGCKKFVDVNPPATNLVTASVYTSNNTAVSAITAIYQQMIGGSTFFGQSSSGQYSFTSIAGLSSDEFQLYSNAAPVLAQAYSNSLNSTSSPFPFWASLYNTIYLANTAIVGLQNSNAISSSLKQQLLGEAKFARAFSFFYLVNIFGDVPLATTNNYLVNNQLSRTPKAQIYDQIIADLSDVQSILSNSFLSPSGVASNERTLPNRGAATALLARTYLYLGKYDSAEIESSILISNSSLYKMVPNLDSIFLKNSNEAIWQLQPVQTGYNTPDGYTYILTTGPNTGSNPLFLSPQILAAFEGGDLRKSHWVINYNTNYSYPYKYKVKGGPSTTPVSEYYMVFRLAEQYLIRAEARVQRGETASAIDDLNIIRNRAGLANYSGATDKSSLLNIIAHERQVELFCEFGNRWLDLKRTGTIDAIMTVVAPSKGGGAWSTSAQLFPIPFTEIQADPNLVQNPGYN